MIFEGTIQFFYSHFLAVLPLFNLQALVTFKLLKLPNYVQFTAIIIKATAIVIFISYKAFSDKPILWYIFREHDQNCESRSTCSVFLL